MFRRTRFKSTCTVTIILAILMAGVLVAAIQYHRAQQAFLRDEVGAHLAESARHWADDIATWRRHRLAGCEQIAHAAGRDPLIASALNGTGNLSGIDSVELWAHDPEYLPMYKTRLIVDSALTVRYVEGRSSGALNAHMIGVLTAAIQTGRSAISDLVPADENQVLHFDIAAPIRTRSGEVVGAALVRLDADALVRTLDPWVQASRTAELVLFHRDGNSSTVLFATGMPFRDPDGGTIHDVHSTAEMRDSPTAFEFTNSRGRRVLAANSVVEGSPWVVGVEMDIGEVLEPLQARGWTSVVFVAALLVGGWCIIALLLVARDQAERRRQWQSQFERDMLSKQLDLFAQMGNDILLVCDGDGRIVNANERASTAYGRSKEELLGLPAHELWAAHSGASADALTTDDARGVRFTAEHRRRDGTAFPVTIHARPVAIGSHTYTHAIVRDLTDAASASAVSESYILANTADAVFTLDKRGMVRAWNRAAETMFGWSASESIGRRLPDVLETEYPGAVTFDVFRSRKFSGNSVAFEARRKTRSGDLVDVDVTVVALRDSDNCIAGYVSMNRDITARKRAERAIRETREQFRQVLEAAGDGVWVIDDAKCTAFANERLGEILGRNVEELAAKRIAEFAHPDLERDFMIAVDSALSGGRCRMQLRLTRPDGHDVSVMVSVAPIHTSDGKICRVVAVFTDVTERNEIEIQLRHAQKMEAVGRLASGVAHDFGNLTMVILGCAQFLLDELPRDSPLRADAEDIYSAGSRAKHLTRQLLAFTHRVRSQPVRTDLNTVVHGVERLLKHAVGEGVLLDITTTAEPVTIYADPNQLEQVILNLAVNARDAMQDGGTLTIHTLNGVRRDGRPSTAVLAVGDSGCGMTPEVRARVFEPFFTTKEQGKGTGLGLSVVYGIVKQAGGTIDVESTPGKGTTFTISLPAAEEHLSAVGGELLTPQASGHRGIRVLVVEDDDRVRRVAVRYLSKNGYEVLEACNGTQALNAVGRGGTDIVLSDVMMPGFSGHELSRRIHATNPALPVLLMSGYSEQQHAMDDGVPVLQKPFTEASLLNVVANALNMSSPPSAPQSAGADRTMILAVDDSAFRDALARPV